MTRRIVLVKHAQPVLDPSVPPRLWRLAQDGEEQARHLAVRLQEFRPFVLACSREPKAVATCDIVAHELGMAMRIVEGLEEFDRPALPIMSPSEHDRLNAAIFEDLSSVVLGAESGSQAQDRFAISVARLVDGAPESSNVVAISHGTVISLFVAKYNGIAPLALWRRLRCPSFVVLGLPGFDLLRVVESAAGRRIEG